MSLNTNMFRSAWARGSSLLRIKLRKPLNTKDEGVSPGCTRLLRKNTCKHMQTHKGHWSASLFWHHLVIPHQLQLEVLSSKANKVSFYEREYWLCDWVIPFCQGSDVLLECWCRETAWADEVLFLHASRCSWSQWAGLPCCHLESCTATPYGNTHCPVHWQWEQLRLMEERVKNCTN